MMYTFGNHTWSSKKKQEVAKKTNWPTIEIMFWQIEKHTDCKLEIPNVQKNKWNPNWVKSKWLESKGEYWLLDMPSASPGI